jgi:2-C-methyl-D-erythritol 2,4-cyclodiphosphate synthase
VNLDCVIFAQRPKILPHRPRILSRIAEILEIDLAAVWLKAKTGEGVGPIGTEEAIAAECVVLLERIEHA